MEVACGEHGDYVQKLVVAVNSGRCTTALSKALEATGQKMIANDISKETTQLKPNGECLSLPNGSAKNAGLAPPTCTTSLLGKRGRIFHLHSTSSRISSFHLHLRSSTIPVLLRSTQESGESQAPPYHRAW